MYLSTLNFFLICNFLKIIFYQHKKLYPEIAEKLLRNEIHDTVDPVIAPRISNKTDEIIKFLEKNNSGMDQYIVQYVCI